MARKRSHTRRTSRANPRGVLVVRSGGFGFVQSAEGEYFISSHDMNGAFDGDLVELAPNTRKGARRGAGRHSESVSGPQERPTARVLRVLERAHDTVIGRYEVAEPFGVVVPEDTRISYDIFTMRSENPDIEDGALVRVRIDQFPTRKTAATGHIEEVIGREGDASLGIDIIVAKNKLETEFSEVALSEARSARVDELGALASGYRDLRDRFIFTIDPADARDFDDAISISTLSDDASRCDSDSSSSYPKGAKWRLGVHIADVAHYVPWDSSIDLDARRRATSVYLADRVIPMIPHELSSDLCSLKPHELRRTMTVDLYLNAAAEVLSYDIYPALIESSARLTYEQAQEMLDSEEAAETAQSASSASVGLSARLRILSSLAKKRAARRAQAGGIDFATVEAKVKLDEEGAPVDIVLRRKTDATELIEEAMILANETVAEYLSSKDFPCMYRVHEKPSADALDALVPVLQEFSWFTEDMVLRLMTGNPHVIQGILEASKGRPEEELVSSLMLRSMKRALSKVENDGHYGLASKAYAHFTSPIRRYPDLVVHRMLKAQLGRRPEKFGSEVSAMKWLAEHSSEMERIADTAARDSQELKIIEYLEQYVGESFSGVVSGVATYGLYVKLDNTAEGFLPVRMLGGEYFSFDPRRYCLTGQDTGKVYRLGQRVAVTLIAADARERKLEFRLANARFARGSGRQADR